MYLSAACAFEKQRGTNSRALGKAKGGKIVQEALR